MHQVELLYRHLRMSDKLSEPNRHQFGGGEAYLNYMVYNHFGPSKLQLSQNYFDGDPIIFTYTTRLVVKHIYDNFYHKIIGDPMRM